MHFFTHLCFYIQVIRGGYLILDQDLQVLSFIRISIDLFECIRFDYEDNTYFKDPEGTVYLFSLFSPELKQCDIETDKVLFPKTVNPYSNSWQLTSKGNFIYLLGKKWYYTDHVTITELDMHPADDLLALYNQNLFFSTSDFDKTTIYITKLNSDDMISNELIAPIYEFPGKIYTVLPITNNRYKILGEITIPDFPSSFTQHIEIIFDPSRPVASSFTIKYPEFYYEYFRSKHDDKALISTYNFENKTCDLAIHPVKNRKINFTKKELLTSSPYPIHCLTTFKNDLLLLSRNNDQSSIAIVNLNCPSFDWYIVEDFGNFAYLSQDSLYYSTSDKIFKVERYNCDLVMESKVEINPRVPFINSFSTYQNRIFFFAHTYNAVGDSRPLFGFTDTNLESFNWVQHPDSSINFIGLMGFYAICYNSDLNVHTFTAVDMLSQNVKHENIFEFSGELISVKLQNNGKLYLYYISPEKEAFVVSISNKGNFRVAKKGPYKTHYFRNDKGQMQGDRFCWIDVDPEKTNYLESAPYKMKFVSNSGNSNSPKDPVAKSRIRSASP